MGAGGEGAGAGGEVRGRAPLAACGRVSLAARRPPPSSGGSVLVSALAGRMRAGERSGWRVAAGSVWCEGGEEAEAGGRSSEAGDVRRLLAR